MFPGPLGLSLAGKALEDGTWNLDITDIRDFGLGKHRRVDDTPSGGGPGMIMRADVLSDAIEAAHRTDQPLIYLSPRGQMFDQAAAQRLKDAGGATLICGRFEGVDERALEAHAVEEISLGDFVLSGGELAAMAMIDSVVRLLPGVVGDEAVLDEESFSDGLLEYPHYTRPQSWDGRDIPAVLLSGNHKEIAAWRKGKAEDITRARRPDLWDRYVAKNKNKNG